MGASSVNTFDDDDACDWVYELEEAECVEFLTTTFSDVSDATDYLERNIGSRALAAAEVVAALQGNPASDLPEHLEEWLDAHRAWDASVLIPQALATIDRVLGKDSELAELWEGNAELYPEWQAHLLDLRHRLQQTT